MVRRYEEEWEEETEREREEQDGKAKARESSLNFSRQLVLKVGRRRETTRENDFGVCFEMDERISFFIFPLTTRDRVRNPRKRKKTQKKNFVLLIKLKKL